MACYNTVAIDVSNDKLQQRKENLSQGGTAS